MECTCSEIERWILPSRLFYYANVYISCKFGFHELGKFKKSHVSFFFFFKHLTVSFAISVWDTEVVQNGSPIQGCIHCFFAVFEHFWQESSPVNFSQNLVWVKVNFSPHSDAFLFWCTLFHINSVSRKVHNTDVHRKFLHKPVKNCIFKTSIKYMVYAVNCTQYIVPYQHSYLYFQRKTQMRIAVSPLWNIKKIH